MKICIICPRAYPLFNKDCKEVFGGAEVQMYHLANQLSQNRLHKVTVLVADYGQKKIENYNGIEVIKSYSFEQNIVFQIFRFISTLLSIQSDVFYQMTLNPLSGIIGWLTRFRNKKFVYLIASDFELNKKGEIFKSKIQGYLAYKVFTKKNNIVCQNLFQYNYLRSMGIPSTIIRSFVVTTQTLPENKKGNYHLWVARSDKLKRAELFLALAEKLPTENFVMICQKSTLVDQTYYQSIVVSATEKKNLKFYKFVDDATLKKLYAEAKTFVNTSEYEGFPTTFIEAGMNSTPIISLKVNPDNFINEYNCGIACNDNFDLMVESFENLINAPSTYKNLSTNIYNYCKKIHNLELNAEDLLSLTNK